MAKKTDIFDDQDFWPEYYLFHIPSIEVWTKLQDLLYCEGITLRPCEDKLYYYEVEDYEQKR